MDWKEILYQIIIALITSSLTSILVYLRAIKEANSKIEEVKINAENEIKKIQEESNKEIIRIRTEYEEQRKSKKNDSKINTKAEEESLKNKYTAKILEEFLENPTKAMEKFSILVDATKKISKKGNY